MLFFYAHWLNIILLQHKKVATASSPLFKYNSNYLALALSIRRYILFKACSLNLYLTGFEICVLPPINGTNASGIVTVPSSFW